MAEAPVSFDQSSALADGEVTVDEMQSALDATVDCLAEVGVGTDVELRDPGAGLSGGWELRFNEPTAGRSAEVVACRAATIGDLEFVFLVGSAAEANERMDRLRECLAEQGVPADRESLEEHFNGNGKPLLDECRS